jgi:methyltransferase-like protein
MKPQTTDIRSENVDEFVNFALQQVEFQAHDGQELLKLGAQNRLAQIFASMVNTPLDFYIDNIKRTHKELIKLVDAYTISYFKAKNDLINKAFRFYTAAGINYFIILNSDTTDNRGVFFDFLEHYETLNINDNLPLNISFLPQGAEDKLDASNEINLAE